MNKKSQKTQTKKSKHLNFMIVNRLWRVGNSFISTLGA